MHPASPTAVQGAAATPQIPQYTIPSMLPGVTTTQPAAQVAVSVRNIVETGEHPTMSRTANPGEPNAKLRATPPVLTPSSTQTIESDATSKSEDASESAANSAVSEPNGRIFCRTGMQLRDLCISLEAGKCSASAITICPYELRDSEVKRLAKALRAEGSKIVKVSLVASKLEEKGFARLADLLKKDSRIRRLTIMNADERNIRPWPIIADALSENQTLEELCIDFNSPYEDKDDRNLIYDALASNTSLKEVWFHNAGMDAQASAVLAKSLKANPRLTQLWLDQSPFEAGSKHAPLMEAIGSHPTLEFVMLSSPLEQDDAIVLMHALKANAVLKRLHLLCAPHASNLAPFTEATQDMLRNNHTLNELRLNWHMLNDENIARLADALGENRGLKTLQLLHSYSAPTQASVQAMTRMLDRNEVIQEIGIEFYEILEEGRRCIAGDDHHANQELRARLEKNRAHQ